MVRTQFILQKSAFTMIELIFAIVIIGITVISLPMMTQATSKGMENNLAQEAIFLASAELNQALSYKWNGNSQENVGELSKIVSAGLGAECNSTTRPGLVHRMCLNDQNVTANLVTLAYPYESINNAAASDINVTEIGTIADASGYKEFYTMDVNVSFKDINGSTSHNMKEIVVAVKKYNPNTNTHENYVVLKTYSANIGETEAAKRVF